MILVCRDCCGGHADSPGSAPGSRFAAFLQSGWRPWTGTRTGSRGAQEVQVRRGRAGPAAGAAPSLPSRKMSLPLGCRRYRPETASALTYTGHGRAYCAELQAKTTETPSIDSTLPVSHITPIVPAGTRLRELGPNHHTDHVGCRGRDTDHKRRLGWLVNRSLARVADDVIAARPLSSLRPVRPGCPMPRLPATGRHQVLVRRIARQLGGRSTGRRGTVRLSAR
jgi:hypothetical protein